MNDLNPFLQIGLSGFRMEKRVNSGIGGQAVIEGIMMRNKDRYSISVRKPDGEIVTKTEPVKGGSREGTWKNIPFIRGIFVFVDSLVTGMQCLMYSADFFMEEDDEEKAARAEKEKGLTKEEIEKLRAKQEKQESAAMTGVLILSFVLAIGIFMILPYFVSSFLGRWIISRWALSALEAVIRIVFFLIYIVAISKMKDIERTFMYHGAEHKCINCLETGHELTVENVLASSRLHKRCGTSFLFYVIVVSIIFIMFIQVDSHILKIVIRLALIPLIAGTAYEIIRLAGSSDNKFVNLLSKPGMGLQKMTTKEPDASMAEVGIASVEAVFDWKAFLAENFGYEFSDEEQTEETKKTVQEDKEEIKEIND